MDEGQAKEVRRCEIERELGEHDGKEALEKACSRSGRLHVRTADGSEYRSQQAASARACKADQA
eukprot:3924227-Rhodomonas_salina.2